MQHRTGQLRESNSDQRARILALLIRARSEWVPLSQILELHISQFGTRILELRHTGFAIENEQNSIGGRRHSRYRLLLGDVSHPKLSDSMIDRTPLASDNSRVSRSDDA